MESFWIACALLTGLTGLGAWERSRRDAARDAVPIRVHVNGTRGKSSVTRLIAGGLREGGIRTIAKTTGTAPRLILPDGAEIPVSRRAPASIREQLWLLREAHRLEARALVAECMAIDPDLQEVSERDMIGATIGVITNARLDHGEVMGRTTADVAEALRRTVPFGGTLVLGSDPGVWRDVVEREAGRRGCAVALAAVDDATLDTLALPVWQRSNYAIALAVTRRLGIPDATALRGMTASAPDPGVCRTNTVRVGTRAVDVIDASAANDPESLRQILGRMERGDISVFNHRADRPVRLLQFAESGVWADPLVRVVVTGDRPDWWSASRARRVMGRRVLPFVALNQIGAWLRSALTDDTAARAVVLCGNSKRLDPSALVASLGD
jgi:poly-gamma-glutamate synthase PgsB/CapB